MISISIFKNFGVRGFRGNLKIMANLRNFSDHTQHKFVDKVQVEVKGGRGGNGCIAFEVVAPNKKKPQGGNGGQGGNVYVMADKAMTSLTLETFHFNGGDGKHGGSAVMTGKRGKDVCIRVPCGVVVTKKPVDDPYSVNYPLGGVDEDIWGDDESEDNATATVCPPPSEEEMLMEQIADLSGEVDDEVIEVLKKHNNNPFKKYMSASGNANDLGNGSGGSGGIMWEKAPGEDSYADYEDEIEPEEVGFELEYDKQTILVARGGDGGLGNYTAKGSKNRKPTLPGQVVKGLFGEEHSLIFELKLIADIGLVGYPNAGKSTLLKALSNANPKIASYPFTTLHPNIGMIEYSDNEKISVADIPGLIDGASENKGLGHEFLKHIERTKVLLYVIDMSGTSNKGDSSMSDGKSTSVKQDPDAVADFLSLRKELELYNPELLDKPSIILANKLDITPRRLQSKRLQRMAMRYGIEHVIYGSAENGDGMGELANTIRKIISEQSCK